jgi:hypothetical protein
MKTDMHYNHHEDHIRSMLNINEPFPVAVQCRPFFRDTSVATYVQNAPGDLLVIEHELDRRITTPDPPVKGVQAYQNYDFARGHLTHQLFHRYGRLPLSARPLPKVKFEGVDNYVKARGDSMRKIVSQQPPTHRYRERPLPVPS